MKNFISFILMALLISASAVKANDISAEADSVEIDIIDSYVTPETPHKFMLSFYTDREVTSNISIAGKYNYTISDKPADFHKFNLDISNLDFKQREVNYVITVKDSAGNEFKSQKYDFYLPQEVKVKSESNFLLFCLFGGTVFALPSPAYVSEPGGTYFSLTKEIPVISFRSQNFNYPFGYFSLEYSHIFRAHVKNFLRAGYKQIIPVPGIEYVSPGINWFSNLKGFNGISPEVTVGWFRLFNTFTVYTRYRYNFQLDKTGNEFHEISIGLYSSFFSVYF